MGQKIAKIVHILQFQEITYIPTQKAQITFLEINSSLLCLALLATSSCMLQKIGSKKAIKNEKYMKNRAEKPP